MNCIKILLVRIINSGVLFATDVTDVTDKLLVTNKIWLFKIAYPLHPFIIRCQYLRIKASTM